MAVFIFGAIFFSFFNSAIISAISPIWKSENSIVQSFRDNSGYFSSKSALVEENTALKNKLSSQDTEIQSLTAQLAGVGSLLTLAGRRPEPDMIVAGVLTRPPQTPYDFIIIDAGAEDSVALGSQILLPEGPAIGEVTEIFPNKAKVKLYSATGMETNAMLERGNVPVTLEGVGGGNFKLTIPRDIIVEKGDRILSPGLSLRHLATAEDISAEATDSFKEVLAIGPANIFSLRFVLVKP